MTLLIRFFCAKENVLNQRARDALQPRRLWPWPRLLMVAALLLLTSGGLFVTGAAVWAEIQYRAGRDALAQRRFAEAQRRLAASARAWPDDAQVCLLAARAARLARDYREAERLLKRYRQLGGATEAEQLESTLQHVQRGELAAGEAFLLTLLEKGYDDAPLVLEALAQGYMHNNRWPHALRCLDRLVEAAPGVTDFRVWRGWVREHLGRREAALDDFRAAVADAPDHEEARLSLAEMLMQTSQPQEAVEHYEWLRQRRPDDNAVRLGLARCRRQLGDRDDARRLLAGLSEDARVLAERGKLAWDEGNAEEAETFYRRSLALVPREREVTYDLLVCLQRQGKNAEAKAYQAQLAEIEADQEDLSKLLNAMIARPDDLTLPCGVAGILLRNGQGEQARAWLDGVLQRDGGYKPAHQLLAEYYRQKGDARRAERHAALAR